ncbi:hypothetical protein vBEcoPHC25922_9 [Escherichia phage vB_EcoP_HC-25922]|uniref:Uncharacterized protein n=2 Tax=Suseptimavirus TaxID=3044836 RepID=A0A8F3HMB2_9CAUD|nr:hypothetical protein PQC41_gp006 [Escherichia phage vB_EcoP_SU7]YP_010673179.1 hypothetical protein PQC44_gp007 [Escherichia phage IME267]UEN68511.1 hypothetical protein [Escherichia phage MLP3]WJJ57292.1 hypothetical protein [Escherichia phage 4E8]QWY14137.1 hypothetical protein SU7_6 [Escherichia phage vB_EcoP_SU7]QYC96885.1 hypothetical protein [Escherichia phage IME267]
MNTRQQFNKEHAAALAALNHNGILDAALEALKETLMRDIVLTEAHENKKREECYQKYKMVGSLKEVIKAAINNAGDIS